MYGMRCEYIRSSRGDTHIKEGSITPQCLCISKIGKLSAWSEMLHFASFFSQRTHTPIQLVSHRYDTAVPLTGSHSSLATEISGDFVSMYMTEELVYCIVYSNTGIQSIFWRFGPTTPPWFLPKVSVYDVRKNDGLSNLMGRSL